MTGLRLSVTSVRRAEPGDLAHLAGIAAATGSSAVHAGASGTVLVVGQPVVGFARVVDLAGAGGPHHHLDRLAVHPAAARRGLGTALLHAAMGVSLEAAGTRLSLLTAAGLPWGRTWCLEHGFTELTATAHSDLWAALAPVRAAEALTSRSGDLPVALVADVAALAAAVTPRPAASVIPLRQGRRGLEVFVQHRASTMDFVPGVVVFPGGRVDERDHSHGAALAVPGADEEAYAAHWARTAFAGAGWARTLLATAVRELAEETGFVVDPRRLVPWDNWVTPIGSARRFDVAFFVLPVGSGEVLGHTTSEASHSQWLPVAELAARTQRGALSMVAPTRTIVDELCALGGLDAVLRLRPRIDAVHHDLTANRPRPPG